MANSDVDSRDGVLDLEDTFWSPWPRGLKSSKIALSSARGQHYFWIVEILLENARNLVENLQRSFAWFPQVEIAWKKFLKTFFAWKQFLKNFFLENTCRLCPWSLALASRGSVLGLEIFLCPWPRALCPRLHLWWIRPNKSDNFDFLWQEVKKMQESVWLCRSKSDMRNNLIILLAFSIWISYLHFRVPFKLNSSFQVCSRGTNPVSCAICTLNLIDYFKYFCCSLNRYQLEMTIYWRWLRVCWKGNKLKLGSRKFTKAFATS